MSSAPGTPIPQEGVGSPKANKGKAKASPKKNPMKAAKAVASPKTVAMKKVIAAKQVKHTQAKTVAGSPPDRKTLLKRFTSSAYHKALKDAVQAGLDEGKAKEVARIAYKKAAEEFGKSE